MKAIPLSELSAKELLSRLKNWVRSKKDDLEINQWIASNKNVIADNIQSENIDNIEEEIKLLEKERRYQNNPVSLHFTYNELIKYYFSSRDKNDENLIKCITYCQKDIDLYPTLKESWIKEELLAAARAFYYFRSPENGDKILKFSFELPKTMPSADILSRIYERQGNLRGAIVVCDKAIKFGIASYKGERFRLVAKKEEAEKFPTYQDYALSVVTGIVSANPGINKGNLIEELSNGNSLLLEEAHEYLSLAIDKGIIHQEKRGRALIHTVTV